MYACHWQIIMTVMPMYVCMLITVSVQSVPSLLPRQWLALPTAYIVWSGFRARCAVVACGMCHPLVVWVYILCCMVSSLNSSASVLTSSCKLVRPQRPLHGIRGESWVVGGVFPFIGPCSQLAAVTLKSYNLHPHIPSTWKHVSKFIWYVCVCDAVVHLIYVHTR